MSLLGFATYSVTDNAINHIAFAQQDNGSGTTTPPSDNMTGSNVSTGTGSAPTPDNNSTGTNSIGGPPDLGLPTDNMSGNTTPQQNTTSLNSQATPEFGPVAILVLVISIISIVTIASRSRLGFRN